MIFSLSKITNIIFAWIMKFLYARIYCIQAIREKELEKQINFLKLKYPYTILRWFHTNTHSGFNIQPYYQVLTPSIMVTPYQCSKML